MLIVRQECDGTILLLGDPNSVFVSRPRFVAFYWWEQNSKSKGLDSIPSPGHVYKCQANFVFHTAMVHPAMLVPCTQTQGWIHTCCLYWCPLCQGNGSLKNMPSHGCLDSKSDTCTFLPLPLSLVAFQCSHFVIILLKPTHFHILHQNKASFCHKFPYYFRKVVAEICHAQLHTRLTSVFGKSNELVSSHLHSFKKVMAEICHCRALYLVCVCL